jgi:Do/DeqQ family serine protease
MRLLIALVFTCLTVFGTSALGATTVPKSQAQVQLSFAPVVKATAPAVVNVYSKTLTTQDTQLGLFNDPFFRQFFGNQGNFSRPRKQVENSLGSGVIVDSAGLIVTNNHVIRGGTDIRVVLADKREFEAKVILADERSDLAILKIDVGDEELAALPFGDSDNLEVGDLVLAIGNPFGVGQTVTSGIVSALARTQVGISDYQFFIQTDAAINPGNSGGALVNMAGELVGINTAIFSRSGGSIGIGFSIPSNMVKTVVQSAESGRKIQRPWSGANLQDVTADIAESLGFARPEGALVASLHPESPLLTAGLKQGDVILALDGHQIENAKEFNYRVATSKIGQASIIEFQRDGKPREASVTFVAAPETTERSETLMEGNSPLQGMVVANLSPAVAEELGVPSSLSGVIALEIKNGPAKRFFRKGDILLEVNGVSIASVDDLQKAVAGDENYWEFEVNRGGRKLKMTLR